MTEDWWTIRTVLGGTKTMRAAADKLLPKFTAEAADTHKNRVARATLNNVLDESIKNVVSKPFSKPLTFSKDTDPAIVEFAKNVNGKGASLTSWAWEPYRDALAMGSTAIFVDYPPAVEGETAAAERSRNPQPYFVHVKVDNILACRFESTPDGPVVSYVRFLETTIEANPDDEFSEVTIERVRILEPGRYRVYRKVAVKDGKASTWDLESKGTLAVKSVPFFVYLAGEPRGNFTAKPPFMDLAYKNIEHWQSSSDQRHILTFSRFAMLCVEGEGTETLNTKTKEGKDAFVLGPMQILKGNWKLIEPSGSAMEAGWKDLSKLEDDMRVMGLQPMIRRATGTVTATERHLDGAEVHTQAQKFALDYASVLTQACKAAAAWMGKADAKAAVGVNTDYGISQKAEKEVEALIKMRSTREISRRTFWSEMRRRDLLSESFDAEAEEAAIENEVPEDLTLPGMGAGAGAA